ncbi:NAD(P)-dependent oxidoreductase [Liquorilactobacillus mali]|uniref:3-hydroxyisobutyrate dehydrogenase n=2 Tax=Liquorilactobacillus mali TaxID=1618 RepID=J0UQ17_9LACO|nr:NAD(P)-dependent oxidoreductase [Liquorilactobacillus mali]EJE97885.1 3-hydroxyisobutyrate dehydrogenase [Liquorilactobacillus mali KCTC 3596 = DSM 20444]KRN09462.1 3-hydroxyisobutyrate dehydrogenase [Liquorilactobacillus mali KCTC 3596 = DSM 20444]MDC7953774.1 NAD(P)-dependent oxidoreductase [Liquorilactobacillus mali]MDV7758150.1 NAD-binding protein [Liquorilactobacillus mali]QFQ75662.1 NAD(P)-dependent oxidoreductase [Liquorilactobacillus mali]
MERMTKLKIGFIGTGVMGAAIAGHLIKAGHKLTVYNRTKSKTDKLVAAGATWADTPTEVAKTSDIVFTMVGFPTDVEEVYFGDKGIFKGLKAGSITVDMTTSRPSLAVKIADYAKKHDFHAVDAPVSGGDVGAQNATLTIMVGGEEETYNELLPLFKVIGKATNFFGAAGSGQHAKMANQIMIAGTMTGLTEMLLYAQHAGLDEQKILETLSAGGANNWSMTNYVPRILKNDFTPGFFARHFLKDLRIALEEADKMGLDLKATAEAKRLYEVMVDVKGLGNQGTQGLINIYK